MYFQNFMDMTFYMKTDYGLLLLEFLLQFKYYLGSITKINGDLLNPKTFDIIAIPIILKDMTLYKENSFRFLQCNVLATM